MMARIPLLVIFLVGYQAVSVATTASIRPDKLKCEYLTNPMGIGTTVPQLTWIPIANVAEGRGQRQTAYQILAATSPEILAEDQGDLWDSGQVESNSTALIPWNGKPLASRIMVHWKVRLWNEADQCGEWSEPAYFSIGLLAPEDWRGEFLSMDDDHQFTTSAHITNLKADLARGHIHLQPAKYFRKEFTAKKKIRRATAYGTALGIYELRVNGQRVGDRYLTPGWTNYQKRLYYQTTDITDLIQPGPNAIGAILTDGWYAGYVAYGLLTQQPGIQHMGRGYYGLTPEISAQIELEYEDGSIETIFTDSSWRTSLGPITEADLLMGEAFDARREMPGWSQPGFDDTDWRSVHVQPRYRGALEPYPGVPVRNTGQLKAQSVAEPTPGTYVFDLGQNFSGVARIQVNAPAGTQVVVRYAEMVNLDGTLLVENLRCARNVDTYTCRGGGQDEIWMPRFTYHGFQYVELTGLPSKPRPEAVTGIVLSSDTPPTSGFACSDPMLNQLFSNIVWTQRSNFVDIPTDCPQRDERMGWMGDAQIYVRTATYNADTAAFYQKWFQDLRDDQWLFGAYPNFVPTPFVRPGPGHAAGWMDAGILCPWTVYRAYGDVQMLQRQWPSMMRFMQWRAARDREKMGMRDGQRYGDWLSLGAPTPIAYIDLAYWIHDCDRMVEMAEALGKTQTAHHFRVLAMELRQNFANQWLDTEGRLKVTNQTATAMAIDLNLLPTSNRKTVGDQLVALLSANDNKMATGFLGTRPLLPALSATGHHGLAGELMQSTRFPSWGYEVANGATTIWERWNSYTKEDGVHSPAMNSFSHYSFGAVCEWMFQNLVGIDCNAPGYREVRIAPRPTGTLTWAKGHYDSIRGRITVSWKKNPQGQLHVSCTVPPNIKALFSIPTVSAENVSESGSPAADAPGVNFLKFQQGTAKYQLESGSYRFVTP